MVFHWLTPSSSRVLFLPEPPAMCSSVGSQSVTCIISFIDLLGRRIKGLETKPTDRIPSRKQKQMLKRCIYSLVVTLQMSLIA